MKLFFGMTVHEWILSITLCVIAFAFFSAPYDGICLILGALFAAWRMHVNMTKKMDDERSPEKLAEGVVDLYKMVEEEMRKLKSDDSTRSSDRKEP
jgi:chromate transport protein ChrA